MTGVELKPGNKRIGKNAVLILAMAAIYFLWGGTYLGMKLAVESLPPYFMAGTRFTTAGLLLYSFARIRGAARPTLRQWLGMGATGSLMLLGSNGLVAWAQQKVPTGVAALLFATVPLWMTALGSVGKNREKPRAGAVAGIAMGLAGVALLVLQPGRGGISGSLDILGVAAILTAALLWTCGSLYSRTAPQPESPMLSSAMQMLSGGVLLFAASLALGEWPKVHLAMLSARSIGGLAYLVVFGSVIAYNAYLWLLKNAEPALVSTYAFVNPVIAMLLGWAALGEQMTGYSLIGAAVIVSAVVLITVTRARTRA